MKTKIKRSYFKGTNFRWVVPQLSAEIWDKKQQFKYRILDTLLASKTAKKGIKYYSIAIESHADGNPHLDMLLILQKRTDLFLDQLDFLCDKHGNLTRYRTLNQAIINYGSKQDTPLTNLENVQYILNEQEIKKDAYAFLQNKMLENPFHFDLEEYVASHNLAKHIKDWKTVKIKIKDMQAATCNLALKQKPNICFIDKKFICQKLTTLQQKEYASWDGYQLIIDYINDIFRYNCTRPFKSKQLYLVGPPNTGKTSLNRQISKYCTTYEIGMNKWFPAYKDGVYKFFSWNEFSLNIMPYPQLLKLLEGSCINLEQKGGAVLRSDNQLIIMNSNFSVRQHLFTKFGTNNKFTYLGTNIQNLSARITEIEIPKDKTLFLLLKLIVPNTEAIST